jgi:hypothetical protein
MADALKTSSSRACCMADAYLGVTMNLKTSSSRGAQLCCDLPLPQVNGLKKWQGLHDSRQRRLPRRFAPRNDENLGSSKISNLRHGSWKASSFTKNCAVTLNPLLVIASVEKQSRFCHLLEESLDCRVTALLAMTTKGRTGLAVKSTGYAIGSWKGAQLCCDLRLPRVIASDPGDSLRRLLEATGIATSLRSSQ